MDAGELDLEDLPPKALRKLIKSILAKRGKPASDKQHAESDKEREALADLHEEKKGKGPAPKVEEDDMPFDLGQDEDEGDDASKTDIDPPDEKPEPPKKRGK